MRAGASSVVQLTRFATNLSRSANSTRRFDGFRSIGRPPNAGATIHTYWHRSSPRL